MMMDEASAAAAGGLPIPLTHHHHSIYSQELHDEEYNLMLMQFHMNQQQQFLASVEEQQHQHMDVASTGDDHTSFFFHNPADQDMEAYTNSAVSSPTLANPSSSPELPSPSSVNPNVSTAMSMDTDMTASSRRSLSIVKASNSSLSSPIIKPLSDPRVSSDPSPLPAPSMMSDTSVTVTDDADFSALFGFDATTTEPLYDVPDHEPNLFQSQNTPANTPVSSGPSSPWDWMSTTSDIPSVGALLVPDPTETIMDHLNVLCPKPLPLLVNPTQTKSRCSSTVRPPRPQHRHLGHSISNPNLRADRKSSLTGSPYAKESIMKPRSRSRSISSGSALNIGTPNSIMYPTPASLFLSHSETSTPASTPTSTPLLPFFAHTQPSMPTTPLLPLFPTPEDVNAAAAYWMQGLSPDQRVSLLLTTPSTVPTMLMDIISPSLSPLALPIDTPASMNDLPTTTTSTSTISDDDEFIASLADFAQPPFTAIDADKTSSDLSSFSLKTSLTVDTDKLACEVGVDGDSSAVTSSDSSDSTASYENDASDEVYDATPSPASCVVVDEEELDDEGLEECARPNGLTEEETEEVVDKDKREMSHVAEEREKERERMMGMGFLCLWKIFQEAHEPQESFTTT
ncbi:hypothetical protein BC829DRAFT_416058 [Chytridium lagenaria]|nr:hypothetical protein BC829DRAFT_416058 [Chytridium lagenaria]